MREGSGHPGTPGTDEVVSVEVRVSGQVQGVGFRYFTHEVARRLGLVGCVVNLRDGGVRAYAEGPRATLKQFLAHLRRGPEPGYVREVRAHWGPATGAYTTFVIERTV